MRNFKKFLALVLAMLMVSACAISVSAFADDNAVTASKFAAAVKNLAKEKYQILIGDENGEVNPNKLVRRDEAAVMFAKLFAGADGKIMEWDSAKTTDYDDVDAEWSFGYINYVTDKELMQGVGDGKFAPTENITLAEVLTIAVNADEDAFNDYLNIEDDNPNAAKWYTNYMRAARNAKFADKLGTADYEAYATKGQVAQIVANMMANNPAIETNFDVDSITGTVSFSPSTVTITGTKSLSFLTASFEEYAAKYGVSADYKALATDGTKIYVEYKEKDDGVSIYNMAVAVSYDDVKVERAPKEDNKDPKKILIDDVLYATDASDIGGNLNVVGGSAGLHDVTVNYIGNNGEVTRYLNGDLKPFFKAVAADETDDGVIDTVALYVYEYGTIEKANDQIAKNASLVDAAIDNVIIKDKDGNKVLNNKEDKFGADKSRKVVFAADSAEEFAYSNEIPVLYRYDVDKNTNEIVIDVWKVAEKVTGKLISYSSTDKSVTIEGSDAYKYLPGDLSKTPEAWTLGQTVSFYTIDGMYAKFTNVSNVAKTLYVENVVISDGVAKVTGYNPADGLKSETLNVSGWTKGGKLFTAYPVAVDSSKTNGLIKLCEDAAGTKDVMTFADGYKYSFQITNDGVYAVQDLAPKAFQADIVGTAALTTGKYLKIADKYVRTGVDETTATAAYKFDGKVISSKVDATKGGTYGEYTFTVESGFAARDAVSFYVITKADDANTAKYVWIDAMGTATTTYVTTLPSEYSIVQVLDPAKAASFDSETYNVVDIFTGKTYDVTSKLAAAVAKGDYIIVKGTEVVDADYTANNWLVSNYVLTVEKEGQLFNYNGVAKRLKVAADMSDATKFVYSLDNNASAKPYDISNITLIKADKDGIITLKDGAAVTESDVAKYLTKDVTTSKTYTFDKAYAVSGKLILVENATPAAPDTDPEADAAKLEAARTALNAAKIAKGDAETALAEAKAAVKYYKDYNNIGADLYDAKAIAAAKTAYDAAVTADTAASTAETKAALAAAKAALVTAVEDAFANTGFFNETKVTAYKGAKVDLAAAADDTAKTAAQTALDAALNALVADTTTTVASAEAAKTALGAAPKVNAATADKNLTDAEAALEKADKAYNEAKAAYDALA